MDGDDITTSVAISMKERGRKDGTMESGCTTRPMGGCTKENSAQASGRVWERCGTRTADS